MSVLLFLALGCTPSPDDTATTETGNTSTGPLPGLTLGDVQTCDNPSRQTLAYERLEIGADWNFAADYRTPAWDRRFGGRGIVVADFDQDGLLDIIAPQTHEDSRLLLGQPGNSFTEKPLPSNILGLQGAVGGSAADIDGDGDLDVFLYGMLSTPVLLFNDGNANFTAEPRPEWDDPDFPGCGNSASWADFDLDGDLDLFYGRLGYVATDPITQVATYRQCRSRLLQNDGTGKFTDIADDWFGEDLQELRVMASGWHQFDDDLWPELYVVADANMENSAGEVTPIIGSNLLYDNDQGALSRLESPSLEVITSGMGLAAGDINADGLIDLMVPGVRELKVMTSSELDVWIDDGTATGLVPDLQENQFVGWGGEYADIDNDGFIDVLVTFGSINGTTSRQFDAIYQGGPSGYTPKANDWHWNDDGPSRGVVVADLNNDGWLDLIKRESGGVVQIDFAACDTQAWLSVDLVGEDGNTAAVGAEIWVTVGAQRYVRTVTAGSTTYTSSGPPSVHFGLGQAQTVDEISVRWPRGGWSVFPSQYVNQRLTITQADDR